ncbi:MAG: serine/threonine protein kinase [Lachnospiraceae bacterium]|nr:serine/threonine protein kinase [Lachnospiraceae bacterium]
MNKVLINRYELIREVGHGGAGLVYLAYDRHLQHEIAIKKLSFKRAKTAGSLFHEVNMLKQMAHPALPIVYDFFHEDEVEGNFSTFDYEPNEGGNGYKNEYMVMEYVRGTNLAEYIKKNGPIMKRQAVMFIEKLLSVIEYLHSFNPPFIYCDLKPENIMLADNNQIKLVDFGTAFVLYSSGNTVVSGTPGFTAPELLTTGSEYHENSDIYSLGAVLYFALTGKIPDTKRLVRNRAQTKIPRGIKRIIACCLHRNPEKRYQNVHQLKADLLNLEYNEFTQVIKRFIYKLFGLIIPVMIFLAGLFVIYRESVNLGIPVLIRSDDSWRWNNDFPLTFAFSSGVLLVLAGFCFMLTNRGQKKRNVKIIKSICLSDKKTVGLWIFFAFILLIFVRPDEVYAVNIDLENQFVLGELPVFIRDRDGYKLLIQNGTIFRPKKDIIIEIPLDKLPEGVEMVLKVVLEGEGGMLESREYVVVVE